MNVGGTKVGYAMCAGGNGLAMYKFDMAKPADRGRHAREPGRRREPDADLGQAVPDETNPASRPATPARSPTTASC